MSQTVVILMPNGRRESLKVTPSSLLNPTFADLCKKHGFEPEKYVLKSSTGKLIDGTIPFRLTGIPNRAVLETSFCGNSRSGNDMGVLVEVCVQLPDGERLSVKLEDSYALWDVIERLLETKPDLLDGDDVEPCLSFMGHTFRGSQALLERTLRDCGISGRDLLRLSFATRDVVSEAVSTELDFTSARNSVIVLNSRASKPPSISNVSPSSGHPTSDQDTASHDGQESSQKMTVTDAVLKGPRKQDMMMSGRAFKNLPDKIPEFSWMPGAQTNGCYQGHIDETSPLEYRSAENVRTKFSNFKFPDKKQEEDEEDENLYALRPFNETCASTSSSVDRQMKIFSLNELNFEVEDIPDEFFNVTVEDLKTMHKLRRQEVKQLSEQPLMSGNSKKRKILQKYSNSTMIRIIFPDKSALQAKFLLTETAQNLYHFVSEALAADLKLERNRFDFVLFTTPPRCEISVSEGKSLLDLNLYPAVNVHFSTDKISQAPFLKWELLEQKVSPNSVFNLQSSTDNSTENVDGRAGQASSTSHPAHYMSNSSPATDEEGSNKDDKLKSSSANHVRVGQSSSSQNDASKGAAAVPKWFTAGLKK